MSPDSPPRRTGERTSPRTYVERVCSRRCAQPPLPHHGYRIGVRHDDNILRLTGKSRKPHLLRLTGENRYPWWGDSGGTAPTSSGTVAEGAPSHPGPTMGTASACGTTTTSFVLPATAESHTPFVLPDPDPVSMGCGRVWLRPIRMTKTDRRRPTFITSCAPSMSFLSEAKNLPLAPHKHTPVSHNLVSSSW